MKTRILKYFLLLCGIALAVSCGGGGGGAGDSTPAVIPTSEILLTPVDSEVEVLQKATLEIDLNDYLILRGKSRLKSEVEDVSEVFLDVSVDGVKFFSDLPMTDLGDGRYEIALFRIPLDKNITFEIRAVNQDGESVLEALEEKVLTSEDFSSQEEPKLGVPVVAVFEFEGQEYTKDEIEDIVGDSGDPEDTDVNDQDGDEGNGGNEEGETSFEEIEVPGAFSILVSEESIKSYNGEYGFWVNIEKNKVSLSSSSNNSVDLILNSFGTEGNMTSVVDEPLVAVSANRMVQSWGEIEAWYENRQDGLKQGFTIREDIGAEEESVQVLMTVDAERVEQVGSSLFFVSEGKTYKYRGLKVWDAMGQILDSRMKVVDGDVVLEFYDSGAVYPVTIDPVITSANTRATIYDTAYVDGKIDTILLEFLDQSSVAGYNTTLLSDWDVLYRGVSLGVNNISIGVQGDNLSLSIYSTNLVTDSNEDNYQLQYKGTVGSNVTLGANFLGAGNLWGYGASDNLEDGAPPVLLQVSINQQVAPAGTDLAGSVVNSANALYSEPIVFRYFGPATYINTVGQIGDAATRSGVQNQRKIFGFFRWDGPDGAVSNDNGLSNVMELTSTNLMTIYINAKASGYYSAFLGGTNSGPTSSSNIDQIDSTANYGRVLDKDLVFSNATAVGGINASGLLNDKSLLPIRIINQWNLGSPTLTQASAYDTSGNGYIDTVELGFSENIVDGFLSGNLDPAKIALSDFSVPGSPGELGGITLNTNVQYISGTNIVNDEFISITYTGGNQHPGTNPKYLQLTGLLRDSFGNQFASNTILATDAASPRLLSVDFSQGVVPSGNIAGNTVNTVVINFSENVIIGGSIGAGNSFVSTPAIGDMTTSGNISGLIAWTGAGNGDMVSRTGSQLVVHEGNVVTVYINGNGSGLFVGGSSAPTTPPTVVVSSNVEDGAGFAADENTEGVTVTNSTPWDVTAPTLTAFTTLNTDSDGGVETLDLAFSENIIDLSITNSDFVLSLTVGGANVAGSANSTLVDYDGSSNLGPNYGDGSDNLFRLTLASESSETGKKVLAIDPNTNLRDAYGNRLTSGTNVGTQYDRAFFIMVSAEFGVVSVGSGNMTGSNVYALGLVYSEPIRVGGGSVALGSGIAGAGNLGDMTNAGNIEGVVTWLPTGSVTNAPGSNWVEHTSANSLTVYINGSGSGYFTGGGVSPAAGLNVSVQDGVLTDFGGLAPVNNTVVGTVSASWNNTVTPATVNQIDFEDTDEDGSMDSAKLYFSDNVFDLSIRNNFFALSDSVGGSNLSASANSTTVNGDATANDNLIQLSFNELEGTEMKVLAIKLDGVRDLWGNRLTSSTNLGSQWNDLAKPVLVGANINYGRVPSGNISGNIVNTLEFIYSENILVGGGNLALGSTKLSAANLGDLTTEKVVEQIVRFTGPGSMTSPSGSHIVEHTSGNVVTLYINGDGSGYFSGGNVSGNISPDGTTVFTPYGYMIKDKYSNSISSTTVTANSASVWDVEPPASENIIVAVLDANFDGDVDTLEVSVPSGDNIIDLSIRSAQFMLESTNGDNVSGGSNTTAVAEITVDSTPDDRYFRVTMSANLTGSDNKIVKYLGSTLRDHWGNRIVPSDNLGQILDIAPPVLLSVLVDRGVAVSGNIQGKPVNTLTFTLSEAIRVGGGSLAVGDNIVSAANLGDTTTANLVLGLASWSGNGDLTSRQGSHIIELTTANVITLFVNGDGSGYFNGGSAGPDATSDFSGVGSLITDLRGNSISSANVLATVVQAWETTPPTINDFYSMDLNDDGSIDNVDVVFSENIIDLSISLNDFALDSDINPGGNTVPSSNSTGVTFPAAVSVGSDNFFNLAFSTEISGTGNKYLFHTSDGGPGNDIRDDYGNRLSTGVAGPSIDKALPVLLTVDYTIFDAPLGTDFYNAGGGNSLNAIRLGYSENITLAMPGAQSSSNSTLGRLGDGVAGSGNGSLSGLVEWAGTGHYPENEGDRDNVLILSDNVVTVYINANRDGIFIENDLAVGPAASNVISNIVSDNAIVRDDANWPVNGNLSVVVSSSTSWDVARPMIDYPTISITSTRGIYDLSTYQPTFDFTEEVMFAGNTEFYHISDNAGYADLSSDNLSLAAANIISLSQVQLFFGPSGNRFKSGNLQFDLDSDIRDIAGNPFAQTSDNVMIDFLVDEVSHYDFETVGNLGLDALVALGNVSRTGGLDAVINGGASITAATNWIIDGNAMFLGSGTDLSATNLDDRNFPQLKGTVEFWYKTPSNPSASHLVFGDTNTPGGNYFTVRYSGAGDLYQYVAHGAALVADNVIDFDLGPESWNHIALTYNEDGAGNVIANGVMDNDEYMNLVNFNPTDQDVIFAPYSDVDNIRFYDVVKSENYQVVYLDRSSSPILKAEYPIDEAFDATLASTLIVSDNFNDFDGWVSSGTNLVPGHHDSGNSIHLRNGPSGLMTFGSNLEKHLFPRYREGSLYFWIRPNHTNNTSVFLLDNADTNRNHFFIQCTGNVTEYKFVAQRDDTSIVDLTTFQLQDYAWNHVAITWDRLTGSINLHVNGSEDLCGNTMGSWIPDGQRFTMTPDGYVDDLVLTNEQLSASFFQNIFNPPTEDFAFYDFDATGTSQLPVNDINWEYWASSNSYNPMFFNGGSPIPHEPRYGELSGNSLFFPDGVGMSVYSLESDFFSSGNGSISFWWKPEYRDDANTIEVLDSDSEHSGNIRDQIYIRSSGNEGVYQLGLIDAQAMSNLVTYRFNPIMERWNHIAMTWGDVTMGDDFEFYLNGVEQDIGIPLGIGTWRPTDQVFSSTPNGALDDIYVESTNYWDSDDVENEYFGSIRNTEEGYLTGGVVVPVDQIFYGFSTHENSRVSHPEPTFSTNLLSERDQTAAGYGGLVGQVASYTLPQNYARLSNDFTGDLGQKDYADDVELSPPSGFSGGATTDWAIYLEDQDSLWVPSLDFNRFPQDHGTVRFWVKPSANAFTGAALPQVFGGNQLDVRRKQDFFTLHGKDGGKYDFEVYENGSVIGTYQDIELHPNTYNHVAVSWSTNANIGAQNNLILFINGRDVYDIDRGNWYPNDQLFVSTPYGSLDSLYLEGMARDEDFISDYFLTYVTPAGYFTFEGNILDVNENPQTGNNGYLNGDDAGVVAADFGPDVGEPSTYDVGSLQYLELAASGDNFEVPSLLKDLFPQEEGVVRYWLHPFDSTYDATPTRYLFDFPEDRQGEHFFIESLNEAGKFRFAMQGISSTNIIASYDFWIDPNDWTHLAFNWSEERDTVNLIIDGEVRFTTTLGSWRPAKQRAYIEPMGMIDDLFISYIYESVYEVREYFYGYRPEPVTGYVQHFGQGTLGQLGTGETSNVPSPKFNHNLVGVLQLAGGEGFGLALMHNSTVMSWGVNTDGQLGDNTLSSRTSPVSVPDLNGVVQVAAGKDFSLAVLSNGNVYGWGNNDKKQLGLTSANYLLPQQITDLEDVVEVAAGATFGLAIHRDRTVSGWGTDLDDQLGLGMGGDVTAIAGVMDIMDVAVGANHSLMLYDNGDGTTRIKSYGENTYGQLGNNSTTDGTDQTVVMVGGGSVTTATNIAAAGDHSMALLSDGTVVTWGRNDYGQLGVNSTTTIGSSSQNSSANTVKNDTTGANTLSSIRSIMAGQFSGYAVGSDGGLWSWGRGLEDQLGNGKSQSTYADNVTGVTLMDNLSLSGWKHVQGIVDGNVYYDGFVDRDTRIRFESNDGSDTGLYNFPARFFGSPTKVLGLIGSGNAWDFESGEYLDVPGLSGNSFPQFQGTYSIWYSPSATTPEGATLLDEIGGSRGNSFVLRYDGGGNVDLYTNGALLTGSNLVASIPVTVGANNFVSFSWDAGTNDLVYAVNGSASSVAVTFSGWAPSDQRTVITPYGIIDDIEISSAFSSGSELEDDYYNTVLGEAGSSVYAWGENSYGQLGDGTTTHQSSPVLVDFGRPADLSLGLNFSLVLLGTGNVMSKGDNFYGQLGDGTYVDKSELTEISGFSTSVVELDAGDQFGIARLSDNTLMSWGHNNFGQLGLASGTTTFNVPTAVGGLVNVEEVATGTGHVLIRLSNGDVYSWGNNNNGQLGHGDTTNRDAPVKIATLSNIVGIACGDLYSMALTNTGDVYIWGDNNYAQLGDGGTTDNPTPTQVGGIFNVTKIAAGQRFAIAQDNLNQIWGWGVNQFSQIDSGQASLVYSPFLIDTVVGVDEMEAGSDHALLLMNDETVMSWGRNTYGQLGQGGTTSNDTPAAVSGMTLILKVKASRNSSFAIQR